jgi:hypothetical protein
MQANEDVRGESDMTELLAWMRRKLQAGHKRTRGLKTAKRTVLKLSPCLPEMCKSVLAMCDLQPTNTNAFSFDLGDPRRMDKIFGDHWDEVQLMKKDKQTGSELLYGYLRINEFALPAPITIKYNREELKLSVVLCWKLTNRHGNKQA